MNPVILAFLKDIGTALLLEVADAAIDMLKDSTDNDVDEHDSRRIKSALKRYKERKENGEIE